MHRMIPRTGIEQPFLIEPPKFIRNTNEFERTNEISNMLKMAIIEDYRMRENNRIVNLAKTVYDLERESPHYKNANEYLNTNDQIRIIKPQVNGRPIDNPRLGVKNRYFKSLNPWYRSYICGQTNQRGDKNPPPLMMSPALAEDDETLIFESRFESGNLKKAI